MKTSRKTFGNIATLAITSLYLITGCSTIKDWADKQEIKYLEEQLTPVKTTVLSPQEMAWRNYCGANSGPYGEAREADYQEAMRNSAGLRGIDTTNWAAYDAFRNATLKPYETTMFPSN